MIHHQTKIGNILKMSLPSSSSYGLVFVHREHGALISGECFIKASEAVYQMLRDIGFRMHPSDAVGGALYLIKYEVPPRSYYTTARAMAANGMWKNHIVGEFSLAGDAGTLKNGTKSLQLHDKNKKWSIEFMAERDTICLPTLIAL